jgi:hypothetical protein
MLQLGRLVEAAQLTHSGGPGARSPRGQVWSSIQGRRSRRRVTLYTVTDTRWPVFSDEL